jgi:hypothetical protein
MTYHHRLQRTRKCHRQSERNGWKRFVNRIRLHHPGEVRGKGDEDMSILAAGNTDGDDVELCETGVEKRRQRQLELNEGGNRWRSRCGTGVDEALPVEVQA